MPTITADQLRLLAKYFSDLASGIQDYIFDHAASLSQAQQTELRHIEQNLAQKSNDLTAQAISLTLDNIQATLDQISDATKKLKDGVSKLKDIAKVIQLGAAGVELAAAVLTENPAAISSAISDTLKTVASIVGPDDGKGGAKT